MSTLRFDFESIKSRIIDRLKAKEAWADILFYSANSRLIDIFAEELAYDMLYDEILTTESKWSLAQQISSLMSETQFFNYYPHRKQGSNGTIRVSTSENFNTSYPLTITIPKFSMFSNGDITFCVSETTPLTFQDLYIDVPVIQGVAKEFIYSALGEVYETFSIKNDSIENSLIEVYLNGESVRLVENIREAADGEDLVCEVKTLSDFSGIQLKFGNGYFGKMLSTNNQVLVKYVETLGKDGNIESSNIVTTVESTFFDTNSNAVDLYCNNVEPLTGGTDIEDVESIRFRAPKAYQTGDRAISKDDYNSIVESFNFVLKSNCWGETEVNEDLGNLPGTFIALEENVVHLAAVNTSGQNITEAQEAQIREELAEKKSPTDIVVFEPIDIVYLVFNVVVYVSDRKYSLSSVKSNIQNKLESTYSLANTNFQTKIRYSDYIALIDNIEGVDWHETNTEFYKLSFFNSAYDGDISLGLNNITPNSIQVYIRDTAEISNYVLIGSDDGSGNLVGESGYDLTGSTIDYDNGLGNLIISDGLTDPYTNFSIKIQYGIEDTSIVLPNRYQLGIYGSSNITAFYE